MVRDLLKVTQVLVAELRQEVKFLHSVLCYISYPFICWKQFHKYCTELKIKRAESTYIPTLKIGKVVPLVNLVFDLLALYFAQWSPALFPSTLLRFGTIYVCYFGLFPYSSICQVMELLTSNNSGFINPLFTTTLYPELALKIFFNFP